IPGLKITPCEYEIEVAMFDISMVAEEKNGQLAFRLFYCTKLFKETTVNRFIAYFKRIAVEVLRDPEIELGEIEIITPLEKKQMLFEFNDTAGEIERDKTYHEKFQEQVLRTPAKDAAIYSGEKIRYDELNENANRLAALLREKGVTCNTLTALVCERSIEMLTAIIAIFKAGGAYVPIEINYPVERIKTILADSQAAVMITTAESLPDPGQFLENISTLKGIENVIFLDRFEAPAEARGRLSAEIIDVKGVEQYPGENLATAARTADLAYVIYTSGTTGTPKGAMIHQLGMLNHLYAMIEGLSITRDDIVAQTASASFDISVWQFLAAPVTGGITYIIDRETVLDPQQ
ncbi:MAG: AMP-binding protein, partial [bacterium]|nr:AMP-binding protein [bacterium]